MTPITFDISGTIEEFDFSQQEAGNQSPFYSFLLAGVIATRMITFHYFHDVLNILKQDKFHNMSISKGRKIAWGIFLAAIVIAAIISVVFCNILPHHVK